MIEARPQPLYKSTCGTCLLSSQCSEQPKMRRAEGLVGIALVGAACCVLAVCAVLSAVSPAPVVLETVAMRDLQLGDAELGRAEQILRGGVAMARRRHMARKAKVQQLYGIGGIGAGEEDENEKVATRVARPGPARARLRADQQCRSTSLDGGRRAMCRRAEAGSGPTNRPLSARCARRFSRACRCAGLGGGDGGGPRLPGDS
jgi:hypothetical protein